MRIRSGVAPPRPAGYPRWHVAPGAVRRDARLGRRQWVAERGRSPRRRPNKTPDDGTTAGSVGWMDVVLTLTLCSVGPDGRYATRSEALWAPGCNWTAPPAAPKSNAVLSPTI